jgi:hypothetical protein
MTARRPRASLPPSDGVAAALRARQYDLVAWCLLEAAVRAMRTLPAATIDDALAALAGDEQDDAP